MKHPTPPPDAFTLPVRVAPADLDEQAHVNNVVYLRWVQDVAIAHWEALSTPELRAELGWVARRHEIDYLAPGLIDDELLLVTWVGPADGLAFERHTEVRRQSDGRVLARARTLWIPVDARTGRPRRVDEAVRGLVSRRP
jgi:acyl-CoA thioester hydrolase